MGFLTEKEMLELKPSELLPHPTPIPTQIVSSDEFTPPPQSEKQKEVESRLLAMADDLGQQAGPEPAPVLPDRGRHGGGLRRAERHLRHGVRCEPRRGRDARDGAGARRLRSKTSSSWTCTRTSCVTTRGW